jgi:hypothetical protein
VRPFGTAVRNRQCEFMDIASIASAIMAAQIGQVQLAAAAKMLKMNADQGAAVTQLIDAAQSNFSSLANAAEGIGSSLNITA